MTARATSLVTGASGFIGARLCAALRERGDVRVRALLRRDQGGAWDERVVLDVAAGVDASATDGVDVVYHLAGYAHALGSGGDDEAVYRRVNVDGTRALLEACKASGVRRFVFMSSVKALGEGGDDVVGGDAKPRPTTVYGRTKREAELLVLEGGYVAEPVVLRPALVYGPGVKGNLRGMIAAVDAGRFPPPPRVRNRRSLVHVDDVVAAAMQCALAAAAVGRAFVATDGRAYSTRDIYEAIVRALGRNVPSWGVPAAAFRALALAGDVVGALARRRAPFDSAAYDKLFGSAQYDGSALAQAVVFEPRWTLEAAMPAMVAAFRGQ